MMFELYFGGTILTTIVVAIILCRYRASRQKQVSYGTLIASSAIANASVFLGLGIYAAGWRIFTREAWTGGKLGLLGVLVVWGSTTIFCLLPALGVAVYYQRRRKRDEKHVD